MSKTQTKTICSKAANLCREMLDLMSEENMSCSIHESELTTSIVLKSCTVTRPGYTIVKSHQADMKNPKVLKNKISTNRVRHATELKVEKDKTQDCESKIEDCPYLPSDDPFQQGEEELIGLSMDKDNDMAPNDEVRKGGNDNLEHGENYCETKAVEGKQPPLPNW